MSKNILADQAIPAADRAVGRLDNLPPAATPLEALQAYLVENHAAKLLGVDPIAERATAAPQDEIKSDEDLALWGQIFLDAKAVGETLDKTRLAEAKPLKGAIDEFFNGSVARCTRIMEKAKALSNVYNRKKVTAANEAAAADRRRLQEIARQAEEDAKIAAEFGDTGKAVEHVEKVAETRQQIATTAAEAPKASEVARVEMSGGSSGSVRMIWKFAVEDFDKIDLAALRPFLATAAIETAIGKLLRAQTDRAKLDGVRFYQEPDTAFRK